MPSFRTPPSGFGISNPPHRLRFVGPVQQLFSDHWPVLFQVVGELVDGDPVHSRATFITFHLSQCFLQVLSLTYFLHQPIGSSWAFGSTCRRGRFSLFSCVTSGCTRQRRREVQCHLEILLLVVFETHGLLTAPSRSGLLRGLDTMPYADFCSAVRSPYGHLSRRSDTEQISWGKFSHSPCTVAESTFRTLMDVDFAVSRPLVRH